MRRGATPQEACEEAIQRVLDKQDVEDAQLGVLALDKQGRTGAFALREGFTFATSNAVLNELEDSRHPAC